MTINKMAEVGSLPRYQADSTPAIPSLGLFVM
jgi:hypothetical protein